MLEVDVKAATAGLSLREAILVVLAAPDLHTEYYGCTLGGLDMLLGGMYDGCVYQEVLALIITRQAFISMPISLADPDAYVGLVDWTVGASTRTDIEARFGEPHGITSAADRRVVTYDIYVENVDDPEGYPGPPEPYAVRDAKEEDRPKECNFPFTPIWPPEAVQIEFVFDHLGVLAKFDFVVGNRLT
jgi:hypothetical protein